MSDAELTILSLIAESARTGYELQQIIDERGLREWLTLGFSSIYYILNKLERQGFLEGRLEIDGQAPPRKRYSLTEAGQGVLQTAVADLLRQPRALGTGFELGLANLSALKPQRVFSVLNQHKRDLQARLHTVEQSWARHQENNSPDHIRALYTHSIALMRAELAWLDDFLAYWQQKHPNVEQDVGIETSDPALAEHRATTIIRRATPDPAKILQKLKRPPKGEADETP